MIDHLLGAWSHNYSHTIFAAGLLIIFLVVVLLIIARRKYAENYLNVGYKPKPNGKNTETRSISKTPSERHDTLFILPDISGYTKFMAGKHFTSETSQFIVFSLINAMTKASKNTLTLSKVEGDAALFFVDAQRHSPQKMGETLVDIFNAFCIERDRLMNESLCSCKVCEHIKTLDLKIFVHRGHAARFEFRGFIDHFGQDLIILYRMMKIKVSSRRYILITDAACNLVELPDAENSSHLDLQIVDIGHIGANKFELTEQVLKKWKERTQNKYPHYRKVKFLIGRLTQAFKNTRCNFRIWMYG